jgi:hypothetical protein
VVAVAFLVVTPQGSAFAFALVDAVAFLVVIPQGSAVALAVACSLNPNYPNPKIVISTEAAHAFVSSEVEKSASLSDPPKTTHSIVFTIAAIYFSPFSAQKSRVKPHNHLNPYQSITSVWHFS